MRIEITKAGIGSKIIDDNGVDITAALGVTAITVKAEVNEPTRAIVESELLEIEAVTGVPPQYIIGQHRDVIGFIKEDGRHEYLPGYENTPPALGFARAGDIIILKSNNVLSQEQHKRIAAHFDSVREKLGVSFVMLDGGIDICKIEKAPQQ